MAERFVSHYKIIKKIGGGGMGVVYKALDTKLGRTVALKFLPPGTTRDERAKKRFLHEAQAASLLDHPNICSIHEIDETPEGQVFISMAYYEGVSLRDRISEAPLDVREAFEIVYSVADGLVSAHGRGIIHRDIKPANVMITTDGFVKVVDFGLAKLADRTRVTRTGHTPGTLSYMSPEQVTGKEVDGRSDIWALGVLAYEALTGKLPFEGDIDAAMMFQILNEEPVSARKHRSQIPAEFETVIHKCLEKDPSRRYQTASEVVDDLAAMGRRLGWYSTGTVRSVMRVGPPQIRTQTRVVAPVVIVLVSLVAVLIAWFVFNRSKQADLYSTDIRLAVLPIENLVGSGVTDEYVDGLSEWIVGKLERISGFHESMWVVPFRFTRPGLLAAPGHAKNAFGVNRLIQGSIQRYGDGYRLALGFYDAESLRRLRATHIDFDDPVPLQQAVVEKSAELLDMSLKDESQRMLSAGSTSNREAFRLYVNGLGHFQKYRRGDNLDRALECFDGAVAADSLYADARAALALARYRHCRTSKDDRLCDTAWTACRSALRIDSNSVYVNLVAGEIAYSAGKTDESIVAHRRVVAVEPSNTRALRRIGDALNRLDRVDEAEAAYRAMVAAKPDCWETHINLAYFLSKRGRTDESIEQYERALALAPDDSWTLHALGTTYFLRDEWSRAREFFLRSFAIEPRCFPCRNIGALYYLEGLYEDAAKYFQFALEYCDSLAPDHYQRWQDWGAALYWVDGKRDEAVEKFRRAIELAEQQLKITGGDTELLAYTAGCYAMVGDRERAIALIDEVTAIGAEDPFVSFIVGQTYEHLGDRERALQFIANAVRLDYSLAQIQAEPLLKDLTQDIRFKHLIEVDVQGEKTGSSETN
ncbi:MAG: protein kinase [Candidatus Latescibacterota bacterium]|nr:MAG: protein kinase [Candidatus Latescibacterota bacterium]